MTRTAISLIAAALAWLALATAVAAEPRLKPIVEVDSEIVTLGDLFDDVGAYAPRSAMAAPPIGESVTLDLATVFDLAYAQGLAWRPAAPFDRVVVRRAARTLPENDILEALSAALRESGAGDRFEIDLSTRALEVLVPRGALVDMAVEDLHYDPTTGGFDATLRVAPAGSKARTYVLAGRAHAMVEIPVLQSRLRADDVIRSADVGWETVRADRVNDRIVTDARELIGMSPRRTVTPGRPIESDHVGAPIVVIKGASVTMRLITPRMELTASGRALESGSIGDVVRIQNADSRIVVEGTVEGPNIVSVRPGRLMTGLD